MKPFHNHLCCVALLGALLVPSSAHAGSLDFLTRTEGSGRPVVLSLMENTRDFDMFASGGSDGNWFVGYTTCWIVKLPTAPAGAYARAFIGAKLGRAKSESVPEAPPWIKRRIRGEIHIAVSDSPTWPASRRFKLADVTDIPAEGNTEATVQGVGESRWFWLEVPLSLIDLEGTNYLALYAATPDTHDAATSPILAGGKSDGSVNAWLNASVEGQPPATGAEALKTRIRFAPALALKLVAPNTHLVAVRSFWARGSDAIEATVLGQDIERVWLEASFDDGETWERQSRFQWGPPYVFRTDLIKDVRDALFRVAAQDISGNEGISRPLIIKNGRRRSGL